MACSPLPGRVLRAAIVPPAGIGRRESGKTMLNIRFGLMFAVVALLTLGVSTRLSAMAPVEANGQVMHFAPLKSEGVRDEISDVRKHKSVIGLLEALERRELLAGTGLTGTYYNSTVLPALTAGS